MYKRKRTKYTGKKNYVNCILNIFCKNNVKSYYKSPGLMKYINHMLCIVLLSFILTVFVSRFPVYAVEVTAAGEPAKEENVYELYQEYRSRFEAVEYAADISANGFTIVKDQIFPIELIVSEKEPEEDETGNEDKEEDDENTTYLIPAFDEKYHRLALFFAQRDGKIFYKTDQLDMNNRNIGQMEQPNTGIAAVSFQDLNGDKLTDVVLITSCVNEDGIYAGKSYKVGEVLFQSEQELGFYRDYRISDKINRFGMNKSAELIAAFVRDGFSTEFMYTAATLEELQKQGMKIITEQYYTRTFEKLGRMQVVPGTYKIADYDVFMIYVVNEEGYIVSSLQPMGEFDNLYALKGIQCRDIDGDGLKDIVVLARYSYEDEEGRLAVKSDYSIYYQRTGGFSADMEIKNSYQCSDEDTMEALVEKARAYWGWKSEQ